MFNIIGNSKQSPNPTMGMRQQRRFVLVLIAIFFVLIFLWYYNISSSREVGTKLKSSRCVNRLRSSDIRRYDHDALNLEFSHVSLLRLNCFFSINVYHFVYSWYVAPWSGLDITGGPMVVVVVVVIYLSTFH